MNQLKAGFHFSYATRGVQYADNSADKSAGVPKQNTRQRRRQWPPPKVTRVDDEPVKNDADQLLIEPISEQCTNCQSLPFA